MSRTYGAIVVGLGAAGSATAYHLARRGVTALGIDQFSPPHPFGSTHGDTRIIRQAIGEGEEYVPFVLRSYELFRDLERESGRELLAQCGGLVITSDAARNEMHVAHFFERTLAAARDFNIRHEVLDAAGIRRRFPQFIVRDDEHAYFEPGAGFLRPEACVGAHLSLAQRHGAEIHREERVLGYTRDGEGVTVTTDRGTYTGERLIISAGPWLPALIGEQYRRLFVVRRQVMSWYEIAAPFGRFAPATFPVFIWQQPGASRGCYGFPAVEGPAGGIKVATEQYETTTTPETVDRDVSVGEAAETYRRHVAGRIDGVGPGALRSVTCLYTCTPDSGFVIDALPDDDRVIVVSPCSGHGFKHSAAIGEALAELVATGASRLDLRPFSLSRFDARTKSA